MENVMMEREEEEREMDYRDDPRKVDTNDLEKETHRSMNPSAGIYHMN